MANNKEKFQVESNNEEIVVRPRASYRILVNQGQLVSTSDMNNLACPECQEPLQFKVTDTKIGGLVPTYSVDHCGKQFVAIPSDTGSGLQINYSITDPEFSVGETSQRKQQRESKLKTEEPITSSGVVVQKEDQNKKQNKKSSAAKKQQSKKANKEQQEEPKQVQDTKKGVSQDKKVESDNISSFD